MAYYYLKLVLPEGQQRIALAGPSAGGSPSSFICEESTRCGPLRA